MFTGAGLVGRAQKVSPTGTAVRRYSKEIGACSKVTGTPVVVPSAFGTV